MSKNDKSNADRNRGQRSQPEHGGMQSRTPSDDPRGAGLTASDRESGQNRTGRTSAGTGR